MTVISIQNVEKVYKLYNKPVDRLKETFHVARRSYHTDHFALKGVSFNVEKGETLGLIGKNGSGKSTLLKIITGVLTPTTGTVNTTGRIAALLELGAGFNPEYTGMENIYLNGTMMGYSREEMEVKVPAIIEFADIGQFINQPVKTYSSGMFARLAFSVAINVDPDILIVDEALSVGDIFFQSKCYRKFEEFAEKGKTILFVSHDMGSIIKYCDRSIVLNEGALIAEGPSRDMVDLYKKIVSNNFSANEDESVTIDKSNPDSFWKEKLSNQNLKYLEYGNQKAGIIDYALFNDKGEITSTVVRNETFSLKIKVEFYEKINDPIFAYTIKDAKGNDITGTNTMFENVGTGIAEQGSIYEISFDQALPLHNGEYLISLGCTGYEDGEFQVYHRLYDLLILNIISDRATVGFFDAESKISIKRN
ncbi:ABC transporter ATP-binding protein [Saccharibacillus kuerlensis]|uniref:ABC transporter ATP-binding protein n=1 Tax=Saccharibacillus kuerlensis TaxID=459527 RepID=A0ABQ2KUG0_9BACL|nr:ABC transporter ATP-binding protein [Saccharibacillus kuerlensis]GGN92975.1 ABC transporter ATP-binding protein [Saccharibacillus kuerlensis]